MKFCRYDPPYADYQKYKDICPEGTFNTLDTQAVSGIVPQDLLSKTNTVVALGTTGSGVSVFVLNLNRVDVRSSAIDQEPYIAIFDHSNLAASGGFLHHGDWEGRTTYPSAKFFELISASGMTLHYPYSTLPRSASGKIEELEGESSHRQAFWASFSALKK